MTPSVTPPSKPVPEPDTAATLAKILGAEAVRPATPADAIDGVQPAFVVEPPTTEAMAKALAWADSNGLRVAPRGGGTRMGWGNRPTAADVILSTRQLNRLIEHAAGDMTATVEAGMTLEALQTELAKAGQGLMLDAPAGDRATIGGLIAVNDSGALRLRYGGIRDLILGVTFVRADGVVAHGGGKVVKNVAGYDMPKLLTGSFGTLGVITRATFRLHPLPAVARTVVVELRQLEDANELVLEILSSTLVPSGLTFEARADGSIRVLARLAGLEPSVVVQAQALRSLVEAHGATDRELDGAESEATWAALLRAPWADEQALVLKLSVLPTDIGATVAAAQEGLLGIGSDASVVMHGHGLGLAHLTLGDDADVEKVVGAIESLRVRLGERDGTVVVLAAPLAVKERMDVFGTIGDALPLMRRVKTEMDPNGTLNPGRFVGGM